MRNTAVEFSLENGSNKHVQDFRRVRTRCALVCTGMAPLLVVFHRLQCVFVLATQTVAIVLLSIVWDTCHTRLTKANLSLGKLNVAPQLNITYDKNVQWQFSEFWKKRRGAG